VTRIRPVDVHRDEADNIRVVAIFSTGSNSEIDFHHVQLVRERMVRERPGLALLALFERHDWRGVWDLIVAGGELSDSCLDDLRYVDSVLKNFLTLNERIEIQRIVILPADYEPVVKLIRRVHPVSDSGPVELENINFYQFFIRTALIFHAVLAEVEALHA
jgi:hypothetical protein